MAGQHLLLVAFTHEAIIPFFFDVHELLVHQYYTEMFSGSTLRMF